MISTLFVILAVLCLALLLILAGKLAKAVVIEAPKQLIQDLAEHPFIATLWLIIAAFMLLPVWIHIF